MIDIAPLAIVQARMRSTRLPGKVLLPLPNGETLLSRAVQAAAAALEWRNVVVATTTDASNDPIAAECAEMGAACFRFDGDEADVLGRFYACAHARRWHPQTVIVRITPDDPWKEPGAIYRVASGERLPVEQGGEAFTLAMLDAAVRRTPPTTATFDRGVLAARAAANPSREHITNALFADRVLSPTTPHPSGTWTVDTPEQFEMVRAYLAQGAE